MTEQLLAQQLESPSGTGRVDPGSPQLAPHPTNRRGMHVVDICILTGHYALPPELGGSGVTRARRNHQVRPDLPSGALDLAVCRCHSVADGKRQEHETETKNREQENSDRSPPPTPPTKDGSAVLLGVAQRPRCRRSLP